MCGFVRLFFPDGLILGMIKGPSKRSIFYVRRDRKSWRGDRVRSRIDGRRGTVPFQRRTTFFLGQAYALWFSIILKTCLLILGKEFGVLPASVKLGLF